MIVFGIASFYYEDVELEVAHELLTEKIAQVIKAGAIPFVIGGGNDQSYPNALGLLKNVDDGKCTVINIDAHLDVRPKKKDKVHSGSPFRLLLEDDRFKGKLIEFAAQGSQCSAEHVEYLKSHPKDTKIIWFLKDIRGSKHSAADIFQNEISQSVFPLFISFDIDAIDSAHCPGVSCPATIGLSSEEALQMCFYAGSNPLVRLFDVSEMNPSIEAYRTGRLVVNMFYYFLLGVASRIKL